MLYVKRVISTLQGGVDVELGPKTLIVGDNGTGKSRIRRSIELALCGVASDIAGRDEVARGIDLLQLATEGKNLVSQAFISDGSEASYQLNRVVRGKGAKTKVSSSEGEIKRPPCVDPDTALPLRTLYDAILGKADTARRFFLSKTVREVTRTDVLSKLTQVLHALYERAVHQSGIQASKPEIDKLLSALEVALKRKGESSREATGAERTAAETGAGLPPPPTEAEYQAARQAVESSKLALEQAAASYQQQTQVTNMNERLAALRAQLQAASDRHEKAKGQLAYIEGEAAKLESIESARAKVPQMPKMQRAVIEAIIAMAEWELENTAATGIPCFCCGSQFTAGGHFVERAKLAKAELDNYAAATAEAQAHLNEVIGYHARKDEVLAGAKFEVEQALADVTMKADAIDHIVDHLGLNGSGTVPADAPDIGTARLTLQAAEDKLRGLDTAKAAWESTRKAKDTAVSAETESNQWAQLADQCSDIVRDLLDQGVAGFSARVQAFLPATDVFRLRLRDGGREVCQFGLQHGDALYTVLSGAEWARVTAALAAVCGPASDDRLAVVCPFWRGERAFDARTLTEVMMALGKVQQQQVILESPIRPTLVPQGWTLVETGQAVRAPAFEEPAGPSFVVPGAALRTTADSGKLLPIHPLVR